MLVRSVFLALTVIMVAAPAWAGSVTYADLRGKWESTKCKPPQPLVIQGKNSEAPASSLNAQMEDKNRFVTESHAYMSCLSAEAQRDAEATGILVTKSAQSIIDKMQAEVDAALGKAPAAPAAVPAPVILPN